MITESSRLLRWFDERVEASSELFGPYSTDNGTEWLREPFLPDRIYLIRGDGSRVDEKACHRMCLAYVLVPRGSNMAAGFNPVRVQLVVQHRDAINDAFLFVIAQLHPIRMHQNTTVTVMRSSEKLEIYLKESGTGPKSGCASAGLR